MNELTMNLNTKLNIPLYEQIYQYIKKEICTGELVHGEKLPSTRALSKYLEVSRSTVELAYEQLFSEGYIESIPCKGYFVAQLDGLYYHEVQKETETTKKIDEKKFQYNFTPYGIDLKSFPYNVWRKVSKEVLLNEDADLFNSGDSHGNQTVSSSGTRSKVQCGPDCSRGRKRIFAVTFRDYSRDEAQDCI